MSRKKIERNDLSCFYDDGLYIPTRTIYIGTVSSESQDEDSVHGKLAARVIKSIHILDNINRKEPINIILNSPGGCEYNGLAIYDALRSTKSKINITVYGDASSMGSVILQAGDKRYLSTNSMVLIHDGTFSYDGESKNFESWGEESKRLRNVIYKIYYKRMKEIKPRITIKEIEQLCAIDKILTAKEAVRLGLADDIIYERNFLRRKK